MFKGVKRVLCVGIDKRCSYAFLLILYGFLLSTKMTTPESAEQWAKEYNINRSTLIHRLNRGMSIKEALETPIKGGKGIGYKPKKKEK